MVDGCFEEHGRWTVRVIGGEAEGELEVEALVRSVGGSRDGRGPIEQVAVGVREGGDAGRGGEHELHQFGLEPGKTRRIRCGEGGTLMWWTRGGGGGVVMRAGKTGVLTSS